MKNKKPKHRTLASFRDELRKKLGDDWDKPKLKTATAIIAEQQAKEREQNIEYLLVAFGVFMSRNEFSLFNTEKHVRCELKKFKSYCKNNNLSLTNLLYHDYSRSGIAFTRVQEKSSRKRPLP